MAAKRLSAGVSTVRARKPTAKAELPGVLYERSGRWWVASMPAIAGAYSQGRTRAEAYENLLDAMAELIKAYKSQARSERARRIVAGV